MLISMKKRCNIVRETMLPASVSIKETILPGTRTPSSAVYYCMGDDVINFGRRRGSRRQGLLLSPSLGGVGEVVGSLSGQVYEISMRLV